VSPTAGRPSTSSIRNGSARFGTSWERRQGYMPRASPQNDHRVDCASRSRRCGSRGASWCRVWQGECERPFFSRGATAPRVYLSGLVYPAMYIPGNVLTGGVDIDFGMSGLVAAWSSASTGFAVPVFRFGILSSATPERAVLRSRCSSQLPVDRYESGRDLLAHPRVVAPAAAWQAWRSRAQP